LSPTSKDPIAAHLKSSRDAIERAGLDAGLLDTARKIADVIAGALRGGNKLLIAGNGGSAADAQHIAGEFLSRLRFDRNPLPAVALTTDSSVLTAVADDYGYDQVFERQVRGLGRPDDVLIAISTSGKSPNVVAALHAARALGIVTIGFTGNGPGAGVMRQLCDHLLAAPSDETPLIQQLHITAAHAICEIVEYNLFRS
jgi:D-sedoheptulose 7-phosphate isomerase